MRKQRSLPKAASLLWRESDQQRDNGFIVRDSVEVTRGQHGPTLQEKAFTRKRHLSQDTQGQYASARPSSGEGVRAERSPTGSQRAGAPGDLKGPL